MNWIAKRKKCRAFARRSVSYRLAGDADDAVKELRADVKRRLKVDYAKLSKTGVAAGEHTLDGKGVSK
ncbi:MAG: hypothetical protein ABIH03_03000 [Pseudomonadota bacterium]